MILFTFTHGCVYFSRAVRPVDFSYKYEAQHECMLLTAPFWQLDDETVLRTASEAFADISCGELNTRPFTSHLISRWLSLRKCPHSPFACINALSAQ
jgi:hypothetical protein